MLKAAGFTTSIRSDIDVATQITQITTQKDFDLGCWVCRCRTTTPRSLSYVQNFWSQSPTNRVGYSNPAWDAALVTALGAKDDVARKVANKTLAELWNKDVPSIAFNTVIERIAWQNKVHGVTMTESSMLPRQGVGREVIHTDQLIRRPGLHGPGRHRFPGPSPWGVPCAVVQPSRPGATARVRSVAAPLASSASIAAVSQPSSGEHFAWCACPAWAGRS